jgi:tetratricopeptide (TPR) repeat protein
LANLQPFLLNKAGRRAPMHRIFGEAALDYYGTLPVREHLYQHFKKGYGKGNNEFDARRASEALYQITQLANTEHTAQETSKKRLVGDLGMLHVPVNLYDHDEQSEKIVLDALTSLADKEKSALAERWKKEVEAFDADDCEKTGPSVREFGNWLAHTASYSLSLAVLEALVRSQEQVLPTEHIEVADSLASLGVLYLTLARFPTAVLLLQRALAIREKVLGPEHPDTASGLNNLAILLKTTGDYSAAEPLLRRSLAIREEVFGPDHPNTAAGLNNLAGLLEVIGDYSAAEPLYRRALAIREKSLGSDHPDTATLLAILLGCLKRSATTRRPSHSTAARWRLRKKP